MMKQFGTQESRNALTRREFLGTTAAAIAGSMLCGCTTSTTQNGDVFICDSPIPQREPVIDIHQHTNYHGRTDDELIAHQVTMGVTHTVLLPAGMFFGLEVDAGGNETVVRLARRDPRFSYFANEVPYLNNTEREIRTYLKRGAIGIGEQKFQLDCDDANMHRVFGIAADFNAPVLMHFQFGKYNTSIERFHKVLEKYPRVNFIGHAQTFWANIDKDHKQENLYPKTPVTPGGMTDRLLSDYPNMFGDTSAGSGLNAFTRDEDHARDFLARHQDKLLFGSDCDDKVGEGAKCQGAQILAAIRELAPNKIVERKILHDNAKKLMRLPNWA
jgi:predicted TIM-barrel fold metal-dependent hydrolase